MIKENKELTPVKCGIASYVRFLQKAAYNPLPVISETPGAIYTPKDNVRGTLNPKSNNTDKWNGILSNLDFEPVLWYQHTFGINDTDSLVEDVKYLYSKGIEVIITPHTLYSQRADKPDGVPSGMRAEEEDFLRRVLPCVKAVAVLSNCACNACITAFPEYKNKFTVVRHGVHNYPGLTKEVARNIYWNNIKENGLSSDKKLKVGKMFFDPNAYLLVSSGFINLGREAVFELRKELEQRTGKKVYALHIGDLHPDAVSSKTWEAYYTLALMKDYGMQDDNTLIQVHVDDDIFPSTLISPDLFYGYNENITQSGRTLHGFGGEEFAILAAAVEGEAETLRKVGFEMAANREEIPEVAANILTMGDLEKADINHNMKIYRNNYSWKNQFEKHLKLINWESGPIPMLDTESRIKIVREPLEQIVRATPLPPTGTYGKLRNLEYIS